MRIFKPLVILFGVMASSLLGTFHATAQAQDQQTISGASINDEAALDQFTAAYGQRHCADIKPALGKSKPWLNGLLGTEHRTEEMVTTAIAMACHDTSATTSDIWTMPMELSLGAPIELQPKAAAPKQAITEPPPIIREPTKAELAAMINAPVNRQAVEALWDGKRKVWFEFYEVQWLNGDPTGALFVTDGSTYLKVSDATSGAPDYADQRQSQCEKKLGPIWEGTYTLGRVSFSGYLMRYRAMLTRVDGPDLHCPVGRGGFALHSLIRHRARPPKTDTKDDEIIVNPGTEGCIAPMEWVIYRQRKFELAKLETPHKLVVKYIDLPGRSTQTSIIDQSKDDAASRPYGGGAGFSFFGLRF